MVEDVDWEGLSSDPQNPGIEFLRERYIQLLEQRGTDPRIGRRLFRQLAQHGIPNPKVILVNSLFQNEGKRLPQLTLEATADAMVAEGVATKLEIHSAEASLEELVTDPHSLITGPKIFQLFARKPATK